MYYLHPFQLFSSLYLLCLLSPSRVAVSPLFVSCSHQHKNALTLPLRHLLYSERDVLSTARPVFKTNKQTEQWNNRSHFSAQTSFWLLLISVCFTFTVKTKYKESTEIHPDRYTKTVSFLGFSPLRQSHFWLTYDTHIGAHVVLPPRSLLLWCFIVNFSDCFCRQTDNPLWCVFSELGLWYPNRPGTSIQLWALMCCVSTCMSACQL